MMEIISGESLSILLGAAGVYRGKVTWIKQSATTHVPDSEMFTTAGTTPVALIPNPTAGFWSQLKSFWLHVTAAATVKIRTTDGVTTADLEWVLDADDKLIYTDAHGWAVFDSTGAMKGAGGGGGGGSPLTVEEQDGVPSVASVTKIKFDNGTVTDDGGGVVSVTNSGSGGGGGLAAAYVL